MESEKSELGLVLAQFGRWSVKHLLVETKLSGHSYVVCDERGHAFDRFPNLAQAILDAALRNDWDQEVVDLADEASQEG